MRETNFNFFKQNENVFKDNIEKKNIYILKLFRDAVIFSVIFSYCTVIVIIIKEKKETICNVNKLFIGN